MSITVMLMTRQTFWTSVAGKSRATKTSGNRGASVTGSVIMTRYSNTGTLTCGIFYFYCGNARKIQFWWYLFAKWLVHVVVNNVHSSKSQFFLKMWLWNNIAFIFSYISYNLAMMTNEENVFLLPDSFCRKWTE